MRCLKEHQLHLNHYNGDLKNIKIGIPYKHKTFEEIKIMVDATDGAMLYCHYLHFEMSVNQTIWGFLNTYKLETKPTLFD
ncbi:MAG: hypothetical protein COB42_06750 [Sulfurimonas sp.]|nr:MAG: hypothetical protein COB42_06750 [Sulfurimonas sp.]